MFLGLAGAIITLAIIVPGLLYIYFGHRIWRKDQVAIETLSLSFPWFLFLIFILFGVLIYGYNAEPVKPGGIHARFDDVLSIGVLVLGLLVNIFFILLNKRGQILIFRVSLETVNNVIQRLLLYRNLHYNLEKNEFDVHLINMKIKISENPRWKFIGIRIETKNAYVKDFIQEDILKIFKGTTSERSHPFLLFVGSTIIGIGSVLGVAFSLA